MTPANQKMDLQGFCIGLIYPVLLPVQVLQLR